MPGVSDRRKMRSSIVLGGQEDSLMRMNTNSKSFVNSAPPSHDDLRKIIKDLEAAVREERERRQQVQQNLKITQQRTLMREKQFYSILQKSHKEVKNFLKPQESAKSGDEIIKIFGEIFQKFEQSNEATNIFIENRYKDNMGMMERRIRQIITVVDQQVSKTKRVSDKNLKNVKKQIEQVLFLAVAIEEENIKFKKRLDEEIFKNKLLNEQKNLLIEEIIQKKKMLLKYYQQGKLSNSRKSSISSKISKVNSIRPVQNVYNTENRQKASTNLNMFKFMCEPSIDVSQFNPSRSVNIGKDSRPLSQTKGHTTDLISASIGHGKFQRLLKTPLKNGGFDRQHEQSTAEKTIKHLRLSLDRQKKKVIELGRVVTQVQNKNNEINEALVQAMEQAKNSGGQNSIEALVKSEKLFQAIRDLKKRLTMCEKPSLHCGWGEIQINDLVATQ